MRNEEENQCGVVGYALLFSPEVIPIKKAICGRTEKGVMGARVASSLSLSK